MDRDARNQERATSAGIEYRGPERRVGSDRRVSAEQSSPLESILNEAPPALVHAGRFQWDAATNRVACSDELYGICGRTPAECDTLEAVLACVHPDDRPRLEAGVDRAIRDRQPFRMRARITRPDGRIRVLDWRGRVRLGTARQMVGLDGFCYDVTEQEQAGERARAGLASQELSGRWLEVRNEERRRIARELHNSTSPILTALVTKLYTLKERNSIPDPVSLRILEETLKLAEDCSGIIRTSAYLLAVA